MDPEGLLPPLQCPPTLSILSQPNQFYTLTSYFLKIHNNVILSSTPGSTQWSFSLTFYHQKPVHASPVLHPSYMPHHLIRLDFITHTIMGEEYRSWSSSVKQASKRMKKKRLIFYDSTITHPSFRAVFPNRRAPARYWALA
jgi:hypothetical protein